MKLAKMLMLACAAILSLVASAQAQCYDKPPPNYTCELQKKWGKCYEPWMIQVVAVAPQRMMSGSQRILIWTSGSQRRPCAM
eukprot:jgi/Picsp_1/1884/NSC_05350-R1_---NA---